jgi:hypothetical protein
VRLDRIIFIVLILSIVLTFPTFSEALDSSRRTAKIIDHGGTLLTIDKGWIHGVDLGMKGWFRFPDKTYGGGNSFTNDGTFEVREVYNDKAGIYVISTPKNKDIKQAVAVLFDDELILRAAVKKSRHLKKKRNRKVKRLSAVVSKRKRPASLLLTGNFFLPAEQSVKDTFGSGIIYPEIRLNSGTFVSSNFYAWGGVSYLLLKGITSYISDEDKLTQFHFSVGCGLVNKFTRFLGIDLRIGGLGVLFKDESLRMEKEKIAFGFTGSGAFLFDWNRRFYSELEVCYSYASKKIDDTDSIRLGGLRFGISFGIKF